MSKRSRAITCIVVLLLAVAATWYWWRGRRVELYGGTTAYMQHLQRLYDATAAELAKSDPLPLDFVEMEQLAQSAQDVFAVYAKSSVAGDSRFSPLATEMMRRGTQLEHAWDAGKTDDAKRAFAEMTVACNTCHMQLVDGKPQKLTAPR